MNNIAKVISIDENVEEEAVIQIKGVEFVTFIAYAPFFIETNKLYHVEISFFVDETGIKENTDKIKSLIRSGETFRYTVNGYLNDEGQLDVSFMIEDEILEDYQYLYGTYVTFQVDRLDSEFLTMTESE